MKLDSICPISDHKVDENTTRISATITALILSIFLISESIIPIVFLMCDFLIRGAKKPQYSLISLISRLIIETFFISPKLINGGPKFFAARIGALFSIVIIFSYFTESILVMYLITVIFGICISLEAILSYCIACKLYPILYKLTYHKSFNL